MTYTIFSLNRTAPEAKRCKNVQVVDLAESGVVKHSQILSLGSA